MALPAIVKTWQYNVNQDLNTTGVALTDRRQLLRNIKNSLIGFGTLPWTVQGSSNSVAAGMDAVDRWAADANLVWLAAPGAHSWIVLRQTGLAATFEICIDLSNADSTKITVVAAVDGTSFAGGSVNNRPTAGTELYITPTAGPDFWFRTSSLTTFDCRLNVMQSNDGECTRIAVFYAGMLASFAVLDKMVYPATGLTTPVFGTWLSYLNTTAGSMAPVKYSQLFGPDGTAGYIYSTARVACNFSTEAVWPLNYYSPLGNCNAKYNDIDGYYGITGIGVAGSATKLGRHGALYDLYLGPNNLGNAGGFPDATNPTYVQMGHVIHPWDGSTLVTT